MTSKSFSTPDSPEAVQALFQEACTLHENGELKKALERYEILLQLLPDSALLHFNCGLAFFEAADHSTAESHYAAATSITPADPDIHYNRGINFRRLNCLEEAIESFEEAIQAGDTSIDTLYNLALSHQDNNNYQAAATLYGMILDADENHLSTLNNFAYLSHKSGDTRKAESLYRQLVRLNPEHSAARHMLNALSGEICETAPIDYVESIFDNYAANFEQNLVQELSYKTPTLLRKRYEMIFPEDKRTSCLDLGCGTGLAGMEFSAFCSNLTGIDISGEMLAVASEKKIYNTLVKTDILDYFSQMSETVDMVVAADVLTYMGNLDELFGKCFATVGKGGLFLFSVEDTDQQDFALKESGRFGHSQAYIRSLCQKNGWNILDLHTSNLRKDNDDWISGTLFILQK